MQQALTYLEIILADNEQLTNYLSAYNNLLLKMKMTYQQDKKENWEKLAAKITDEERAFLQQTIAFFRSYATRVYIKINSTAMKKELKLNKESAEELKKLYGIIKTNALPNYDTCEEYVQEITNMLSQNINVASALQSKEKTASISQLTHAPSINEDGT